MEKILTFKSLQKLLFAAVSVFALSSCEDVIDLDAETGPTQLVVDGWITNEAGPQVIKLNWSAGYFDNSTPRPVLGATVTVTDGQGKTYIFKDSTNQGQYTWWGAAKDTLGRVGRKYNLEIRHENEIYTSSTELKRVPKIDSIIYRNEKLPFDPDKGPREGYVAEFYARDFLGTGDTYWIKPVVNGKASVPRATNLSLAYDAAFGAGSPSDGLIFILPLRQSITTDSLYSAGASIGVELHSISNETFDFLQQVREQANNGGLFATPISNVRTNIINKDPQGRKALGHFAASAVSRMETVIDPAKARPDEE